VDNDKEFADRQAIIRPWEFKPTSLIRIEVGSAATIKTSTACCASTSQRNAEWTRAEKIN
jgi:hypothetical protein